MYDSILALGVGTFFLPLSLLFIDFLSTFERSVKAWSPNFCVSSFMFSLTSRWPSAFLSVKVSSASGVTSSLQFTSATREFSKNSKFCFSDCFSRFEAIFKMSCEITVMSDCSFSNSVFSSFSVLQSCLSSKTLISLSTSLVTPSSSDDAHSSDSKSSESSESSSSSFLSLSISSFSISCWYLSFRLSNFSLFSSFFFASLSTTFCTYLSHLSAGLSTSILFANFFA